MRVGPSRYRWEFRLLPDETADDFSTVATLYPLIRPWVDGVAPERLQLVRVAEYTFRAQIADRWRRDNIFLLGDAARLTPPFIGQGLCAGIRDAMNLGYRRHHRWRTGCTPGCLSGSFEVTSLRIEACRECQRNRPRFSWPRRRPGPCSRT